MTLMLARTRPCGSTISSARPRRTSGTSAARTGRVCEREHHQRQVHEREQDEQALGLHECSFGLKLLF